MHSCRKPLYRLLLAACLATVMAGPALAGAPGATAPGPDIWGPALRMLLSLAAVLGLLAACAWGFQRLRSGGAFRAGAIEVVSGISLGGREKVVLLRVAGEEILVGISPAGMRPLHVLKQPPARPEFGKYMEQQS